VLADGGTFSNGRGQAQRRHIHISAWRPVSGRGDQARQDRMAAAKQQ
jgi:hypothetical protein